MIVCIVDSTYAFFPDIAWLCDPCQHISREEANYSDFEFDPEGFLQINNSAGVFLLNTLGEECNTREECIEELRMPGADDGQGSSSDCGFCEVCQLIVTKFICLS